ncbi:hypothetical protein GRAQ_00081 [Rahnella aquatilis CIP 78.65 = ATCC 33071]|uniref:Uncharacterized protein n=1 Tax=Rahnella aquatilis (strain ATCC 33071 / DSM 4594 / JCM 1683 / NBRC 105701 / NCIMB 13365 / CIP 78.65) TaxID=745277 RepID=H2IYK0_RAHAC|nr:hypothetical protein [Rahnella aquatilis]AEX50936.1 hypothetical protein Rahaq2_1044 [Rahnella aquatilis CIP 78.65 = ATCC 33071]KFD18530.1 hypothetical protein GRAQ_00081 [Rahnella aquatilis CIP 78.65 = ATCC 33071]
MKIVVIVLSLALISGTIHAKRCTERDAEAADLAIDNLDSWEAIQKNYIAYAQCDDGSIAEGNSEAMARMLVDKWPEIVKLQSLISQDSGFEKYILRHIDSTLDTDDLNQIITLSSESCPAENKALCSKLIAAAQNAEK